MRVESLVVITPRPTLTRKGRGINEFLEVPFVGPLKIY